MRLAAVMLAAGAGRRMGADKLEATKEGRPLLSHALENLLQAPVEAVILVTRGGLQAARVAEIADPRVRAVTNPRPEAGLSTSLRLGVQAVPPGIEGIFIALADMPRVGGAVYGRLAEAFRGVGGSRPIAPFHAGRRGNPVLLPAAWARAAAVQLEGDRGFGPLLDEVGPFLVRCEMDDPGVLLDVDRPADLEAWRRC